MDLILAPYLTKELGFRQHDSSNNGTGGSRPNDYSQMRDWYESVKALDTHAIIVHNELSTCFTTTYTTPFITFFEWTKQHRPSYNDERFYCYYHILKHNPHVTRVFLTDLYDVTFLRNPFLLMDKHPEYDIFSGRETLHGDGARWMRDKCKEMRYPTSRKNFAAHHFLYNAGIIGGKRTPIMALLRIMLKDFDALNQKYNANMPVYNRCIETLEKTYQIFTGYPLHNAFRTYFSLPGTYIQHK